MNSVFSAFKTGKSGDNTNSNSNQNSSNLSSKNKNVSSNSGSSSNIVNGSNSSVIVNGTGKKISLSSNQDPTSYENLRHIRELTMTSNYMADENVVLTPSPVIANHQKSQSVDVLGLDFKELCTEDVDSVDSAKNTDTYLSSPSIPYSAALPPTGKSMTTSTSTTPASLSHEPNSEPNLLAVANKLSKMGTTNDNETSDNEHNFMNKIKARSEQLIGVCSSNNCVSTNNINSNNNSSSSSNNNNSRFNKPRLSLSNASGIGFNNSMPSVHGRSSTSSNTSNGAAPTRTRLSTHQRNLSLDFRSMGILLPPISQVTNTRINLTQHHRNRSLDSALQRIPEVEVSSPSAESENTLCTNTILGSQICTKLTTTDASSAESSFETKNQNLPNKSTNSLKIAPIDVPDPEIDEIDGNTNKKMSSSSSSTSSKDGETEEVGTEIACSKINKNNNKENRSSIKNNNSGKEMTKECDTIKKREDLTSLGSDDSGIICCSEGDQQSLNRIRRSRESLDSGEIDPSEEECGIELLETTSMDEEYRMLQNDLCFYPSNNDVKSSVERKGPPLKTICVPIDYEDHKGHVSSPGSPVSDVEQTSSTATNVSSASKQSSSCASSSSQDTIIVKPVPIDGTNASSSSSSNTKNEVMFRNFFGATKNRIFRTAQSIRENHDKKRKSDQEPGVVKSPVEITKKRDFSMLRPMSRRNNTQQPSPVAELTVPEITSTQIVKSPSNTSLSSIGKEKRLPGIAQCMVVSSTSSNTETGTKPKEDRGHSSLLRFFESPIFNIHFAIHYLFYSKEPGVLSFIVNKIFSFPDTEVDLYIPQLILMYIQMDELTEVLDPYLTYRCRRSADFSLKCIWLFEAYNFNIDTINNKKSHLALIRELQSKREKKLNHHTKDQIMHQHHHQNTRKTHHRSQSDATGILINCKNVTTPTTLPSSSSKLYYPSQQQTQTTTTTTKLSSLGDLNSGRAFDNNCVCFESVRGTVNDLLGQETVCSCGAPKLTPQKEFMRALIDIGKTLTSLQTKIEKTSRLRVLLNLINKNLPARVWLPLYSEIPHHVVRITEEKTAVLNSKDKTPYIIYVEVVEVSDIYTSPVIPKLMPTLRHTKSVEFLEGLCAPPATSSSNQPEDDIWSQEDDLITAQYLNIHKLSEKDAVSQLSLDSMDSREASAPTLFNIGDVRVRHCANLNTENDKKSFRNDQDDPSAAVLKEPWDEKERQIRESSPYGHLQNWKLLSAIVKCGDDLRQELMATQLLEIFKIIWEEESVDLWVRPYRIVCLSNDSGLIEPILNTVSLHQIKKNSKKSLHDYFVDEYGGDETEEFKMAQRNFLHSYAAYCLISYLLQVKDRHNGNILLHSDGHLIHIDFGFILSISPKNLGFEQSPFKLTPEYVEVLGGDESELYQEFKHLLLKGLMAARKHMDRIINIVEIMRSSSQLPCFKNGCARTVRDLRNRFHMNLTEEELQRKVEQLVQDSLNSYTTKLYDGYQYFTNGIL